MTAVEPELAKVAWRAWVRHGCPADVAGMGKILEIVLPEYERRREGGNVNDTGWRTSSYCSAANGCVEIRAVDAADYLHAVARDNLPTVEEHVAAMGAPQ